MTDLPTDVFDHPNWDEDDGWLLTLPPPKVGDACVLPTIINGNRLVWSAHWLVDDIGGSAYSYSNLGHPLRSVGQFVETRRWTK